MLRLSDNQIQVLTSLTGCTLISDANVSKYSTMKLNANGNLVKVTSLESLKKIVSFLRKEEVPYRPIGWGANFILPEDLNFLLIKVELPFDKSTVTAEKKTHYLPASTPLNILTSLASKYGLKGWEVFTGVPASLGGAIAMNAGTSLGEIGELILSVDILRESGKIEKYNVNESSFSYRHNHFLNTGDIIVGAEVTHKGIDPELSETIKKYLKMRTDSQPLREKTCGCMFKNSHITNAGEAMTCRAGLYIDIMGLKGLSAGDMRISPKHANFMENRGDSGSSDVKKLVEKAITELELHYGVKFETEVHLP